MAERVCAIVAFSEILTSGGIVKGGCSSFMFIPPFDLNFLKMKIYEVEIYHHFVEQGDCPANYLGLVAFSTKPLSSLKACFDYILDFPSQSFIDAISIKRLDSDKQSLLQSVKDDDDILFKFE